MDKVVSLAPYVRGCTFDGEKGAFVIPISEKAALNRLKTSSPLVRVGASEPSAVEDSLARELGRYKTSNNRLPAALVIEEVGGYALGNSYEAALKNAEGSTSQVPGGIEENAPQELRFSRNNVVRDKIVLVTGAAQGFGEGIVRELAFAGAFVVVADLNVQGAETVAADLNKSYGKTTAMAVEVNVSDEDSVAAMVDRVVSTVGGIDICISNAGVLKAGSVKELSLKDFRFVTDVNYIGYFLCTKHTSPVMAAQSRGALNSQAGTYYSDIIQINSKSGLEGSNKNGAYAGGKFGGIGLTQSFAKELVSDCIKVNSICPGNFFDGPLWSDPEKGLFVQYLRAGKVPGAKEIADVKRFYEAKVPMNRGCTVQDVVKAIYYLVDQNYETGQAIPVTGGQVMLK